MFDGAQTRMFCDTTELFCFLSSMPQHTVGKYSGGNLGVQFRISEIDYNLIP